MNLSVGVRPLSGCALIRWTSTLGAGQPLLDLTFAGNQKGVSCGRVGPRDFTRSLSQNRAGTSRFTRLPLSVPRLFHERASEQTAGVPG